MGWGEGILEMVVRVVNESEVIRDVSGVE